MKKPTPQELAEQLIARADEETKKKHGAGVYLAVTAYVVEHDGRRYLISVKEID